MARKSRRSPDAEGFDFKKMMKTAEGRWFYVPALIAIFVIAGLGLIAQLLQLGDRIPPWGLTVPAAGAVTFYYVFQLRQIWHVHIRKDVTKMDRSSGVGKQTVSGSAVAPVIHGNGNVVSIGARQDDERKARIQYAGTASILPAAEAWYGIDLTNPSPTHTARTAVVTGMELFTDCGPDGPRSFRSSLGVTMFEENPRGDHDIQVGVKYLKRTKNVRIPPGEQRTVYVKGDPTWETYLVRATLHIFGPALEDLRVTDYWLTPKGFEWNLTRKGAPPPNPFEAEAALRATG